MPTRGQRVTQAIKSRHRGKMLALASDLNVDESAISRWKKGGAISLENAAQLCTVLDVSLDWLVLGRGHPEIHKQHALSLDELSLAEAAGFLNEAARKTLVAFLHAVDGR